jgi:FdhD protein
LESHCRRWVKLRCSCGGIALGDILLVTTGRLTSEVLLKAAWVGLRMLASENAATSLEVELAGKLTFR